jgi:hypothetical protein
LTREKVELRLLTHSPHNPHFFPLALFRLWLLGLPALPAVVEEVEARHLAVHLHLIPPFPLEYLLAQVLRHQIQDLVAVEVAVVVVADLMVRLCLQVLQVPLVPLVPKALWALHFIFRHRIILSLISLFSKWHKL